MQFSNSQNLSLNAIKNIEFNVEVKERIKQVV